MSIRPGRPEGEAGEIWDELNATGAVVVGRRTAEQVDYYGGEHHGVPLFVVSHNPPPVHGAVTARTALAAGVLDELQISQVPVLFGSGMRLFDVLPRRIELEIVRVIDTPQATHIRYRVS
ncbi:dihydrofolate reductase family protein [Kribbella jejuensis]|uniref:dihydrofolate reductase family protein n=1 Tax=Kribbella jejuensis TaxID=236068 RepID=UPI0011531550|nr:hypothetical protein [Kribbella jejuensis]